VALAAGAIDQVEVFSQIFKKLHFAASGD